MPKKIFDIIPPNLASDMENKIKNLVGGKKNKEKNKKRGRGKKTPSVGWSFGFFRRLSSFSGYLFIFQVSVFVFFPPKRFLILFSISDAKLGGIIS
ncbi:hypothetical protein KKH26_01660, partial [Patescibacteria group bacterium]|nr:hypothetical protein [Patescibacteria group bacterium]